MISPDTIEKIMDAARIDEVVGEFVTLKKRGVNLIGLCPFHNEKTPSFSVSSPKGIFKCFGCGKGGNVVQFLMEHEHYTYPEALRYLAEKYSIEIEEEKPTPEQQKAMDEKESLFNLSAFAQKYFEEQLHESEEGKSVGLTYLRERGFSAEQIKKFGLGYCPGKWDSFTQTALKHGYKKEYLLRASLSKVKDQLLYDSFRGRIVFPIHNLSGRVLGFGARTLTSDKKRPKYINSAESEIYHKGKILYGIYFAKSPMASADNCYLVEGYTDVISLHQAGIENVVASSGTALGPEQIKLIRRYTPNVTLLFDGDPAGIKAAFRGIDLILEEGLNVRIVLFPEGEDPDSYARKYRPAEVRDFVGSNAQDFISFKTEMLAGESREDPIKKAGIIKEVARTISLMPDPIARTVYVQKCSEMMKIGENLLVSEISKLRRQKYLKKNQAAPDRSTEEAAGRVAQPAVPQKQDEGEENGSQEKELIRLLLLYGGHELVFEVENEDRHIEEVKVMVAEFIVQDIESDKLEFDNRECREIFGDFSLMLKQKKLPDIRFFTSHQDSGVRKLAVDLLSDPYTLSKNWGHRHKIYVVGEEEDLKPRVMQAVYAFKLKKLEQMIAENRREIKQLSKDGQPGEDNRLMELIAEGRDLLSKRSLFATALHRVVTR